MTDDDIKALREAIAAGPTPGPWEQRTFFDHDGPPSCDDIQVCASTPNGRYSSALLTMDWCGKPREFEFERESAQSTAAYIAAASPDRIARLLDALDEARRDAERYRWLRDKSAYVGINPHARTCLWVLRGILELPRQGFDAAIDAAMKEPTK